MPDAKAGTNLRQTVANKLLPGYLIASRWDVAFNRETAYWSGLFSSKQ
jgi:hypothetical protein